MVTSQAVPVPMMPVSTATPAKSLKVVHSVPGRTLTIRCGQMLSFGASASVMIDTTGRARIARQRATETVQIGDTRRRARHAASRRSGAVSRSEASEGTAGVGGLDIGGGLAGMAAE